MFNFINKIKQKKILKEFANESDQVNDILNNKDNLTWEYILGAELLKSRVTEIKKEYKKLKSSSLKENKINLINEHLFKLRVASICDDASSIVESLYDMIINGLQKSFGPPGKPGDAIKIKRTIDKINELCMQLVQIESDIRCIESPKDYIDFRKSLEGITYPILESVFKFENDFTKFVNNLKNPDYKGEKVITIKWDVSSKINKAMLELDMIKIRRRTNIRPIKSMSNMKSGYFDLIDLLTYARSNREIPHKKNDVKVFKQFQDKYMILVGGVPKIPGWYSWVNSNISDVNRCPVYIGQSQTRNTSSLYDRLKEEFLDEYVAIWVTEWAHDEVVNTLSDKYNGKYDSAIKRSAKKAYSTHIVWIGNEGITDDQLNYVENILIKEFKPSANSRRPSYIKSYPELYEEVANELINNINKISKYSEM